MSVRTLTWSRWVELIAVVGLMSVMGCATMVWWGTPTNVRATTLSLGMPKQQVQSLLGPPRSAMTRQLGDVMVETWNYLDQTLTLHNGLLYSWGGASNTQSSDQAQAGSCPTCGR